MKEKISSIFNWGAGTFQVITKSKLVSIGCFLFQGTLHVINPVGSLRWDARTLAVFVALYAAVSIVFVLTNKNETVGKGKKLAGDLVKGTIEGKRDPVKHGQELLIKSPALKEQAKKSSDRLDQHLSVLSEKQKKATGAGKAVSLIFYSVLLAGAVLLFFRSDINIIAIHIIIGVLLIADGISTVASVITAQKNGIPMKNRRLSLALGIFTVALGVAFTVLVWNTAVIVMQIFGAVLILKGIADLVLMIRNREILSSVKDTVQQIKQQ